VHHRITAIGDRVAQPQAPVALLSERDAASEQLTPLSPAQREFRP
jgi:hypothetical protein